MIRIRVFSISYNLDYFILNSVLNYLKCNENLVITTYFCLITYFQWWSTKETLWMKETNCDSVRFVLSSETIFIDVTFKWYYFSKQHRGNLQLTSYKNYDMTDGKNKPWNSDAIESVGHYGYVAGAFRIITHNKSWWIHHIVQFLHVTVCASTVDKSMIYVQVHKVQIAPQTVSITY